MAEFVGELPEEVHYGAGYNSGYNKFADELRENPGRWAVYPGELSTRKSMDCTVDAIRHGRRPKVFPLGEFDAVVRNGAVYVRAVPE